MAEPANSNCDRPPNVPRALAATPGHLPTCAERAPASISHGVENEIEQDLVDQLFNSSEKRLARTLLLLARYGNHDKPVREVPSISQETLAEMVGTTRSRVNFFMKKFQRLGFIDYSDGLKLNNSLLTVVLHDEGNTSRLGSALPLARDGPPRLVVHARSQEIGDRLDDVGDRFFGVGGLQRPRAASMIWRARFASTTRP